MNHPPLPSDCRKREGVTVNVGDRLDVTVLRYDAALNRANNRIARCAAWVDTTFPPKK